ncbi:hypothetical protein BB560_000401 [Smittium megazygosporum]|uniref:t-SNARE coiled-coil homology domain-containing protein n=1 Tax=Smittium megazygosporum TaxID=133381 RepID=A0A2T9ZKJ8_9FUNG|nr:hypothetical protein BB560_000401 [Smittium megazygosporum]
MDSIDRISDETEFISMVDQLKFQIKDLENDTNSIGPLYEHVLSSISDQESRSAHADLERATLMIDSKISELKAQISNLQFQCSSSELSRSQAAGRMSRLQTAAKAFKEVISSYQETKHVYLVKNNQRLKRQYKLARPDATDEEIDEAIHSDQAGKVFTQAILSSQRPQNAKRVLKEVETRQRDILDLEKNIHQLAVLFEELNEMVNSQQEAIDSIEYVVEEANVNVLEADENVSKAIVHRKNARKRTWCIILLLIVLIAVIVVIVYFTVIRK